MEAEAPSRARSRGLGGVGPFDLEQREPALGGSKAKPRPVDRAFSVLLRSGCRLRRLRRQQGQTHVQAYTKPLLKKIVEGKIDPRFVVTHPASLEDAPAMYKKFRDKTDGVIKVVLRPGR